MQRRTILKGMIAGCSFAGVPSLAVAAGQLAQISIRPEEKAYLDKIKNFNTHFADDIILRGTDHELLTSVAARLKRVQQLVGHGNFASLSFKSALAFARRYPAIGDFPHEEIEFLEQIFYRNAQDYGFFGEKVVDKLSSAIHHKEIAKIHGTGNYLFRGNSLALYEQIRQDIGPNIILTSGVRGVVKQMYLFLNKSINSKGNLSMASRSIAPPGYSFHSSGDFDVGKTGFGYRNFTEAFAKTEEFKRLEELGYIRIRYHKDNPFGVRFEPWHIKVTS